MTKRNATPLVIGGIEATPLCLGTMNFGQQTGEDDARQILDAYIAAGGNFLDTADTYCEGESERIVGRYARSLGGTAIVATKVGNPVPEIDDNGGLAPERIERACQLSLERLGSDRIDLYYLHLDDPATPLDEIVSAIGGLQAAGRIRAWGFSNFRPWKIAEMIRLADKLGVARPVAAQPYYHLLNRVAEADYIPACRHFGIGVVAYSPLARGVLTGKYRHGVPEGSRGARGDTRFLETEFTPKTLERAAAFVDYAEASGRTPMSLAVRWILANSAVSSVLAGPRTLEQLEGYLPAPDTAYGEDDEDFLGTLCAPGHTPVPEFNDPRYPLAGRFPDPA